MNRLPFLPFFISAILMIIVPFQPWGQMGFVTLSYSSVLFLFGGCWQAYKSQHSQSSSLQVTETKELDSSLIEEEQQKFIESLRHQRHDWLNHFQVLLGYMKLQRYDLGEEYITRVTESTNNDSRIAGLGMPSLVVYLQTYNAMHKDMNLEVEVPELIDLRKIPIQQQKVIYQLMTGIIDAYRIHSLDNEGLPNTLVILLQKLEETLYVSIEYEGYLQAEECLQELCSLAKQWGNEEGFFVEGLHNKQESIMEFYVPLSVEREHEVKG